MRNEQDFILYPYTGGDTILLQSDKRFARINLRTGEGIISAKNEQYANSQKLAFSNLPCTLPETVKTAIQEYLWHNNGKDGNVAGVMSYANKPLFSKVN